ncbi:unnamed protein product [Acanthoscelides obtectus]|uniref:Uncharacterized protein n=1 Tax=Acanthoscelides obtectus TaxID=200917 RepID=A0A9P0MCC5_ACAOB|nr:unnamed protein product [Acanthoscelides obtectus]CAK1663197.1 hypothetical protein AOBTE_LOCUS23546 [Acanthoscelides obtectus]
MQRPGLVQIVTLKIHPLLRLRPGPLLLGPLIPASLPGGSHDPDSAIVEIYPTLNSTPANLLENVISPIPKTSAKAAVKTRGR